MWLALLLLLAACGAGGPASQGEPTRLPASTATAQPTITREATGGGTAAPATAVPTMAPANPPTEQPTATPLPTITPATDAGSIYVSRDGQLVAYDLGSETARTTGVKTSGYFRISPNGRLVALVSAEHTSDQGALTVVSLDGRESFSVADSGVTIDLAWAPDSSALAYVVAGGERLLYPTHCSRASEVWVFELASSERRKVGNGCNPAWSPDGKRLAYVGPADIIDDPQNELFLVNRKGENRWTPLRGTIEDQRFPLPRQTFYSPFWLADGGHVFVFARFSEFAETSWSTIEMVDSFQGTTQAIGVVVDLSGLRVRTAPDRRRIAFASSGAKGTTSINVHTLLADERTWQVPWQPETSVVLRDREGPDVEHAYAAAWSPDGSQLAVLYCSSREDPIGICQPGTPGELRLMDPATGELSEPLLSGIDLDGGIDWVRRR